MFKIIVEKHIKCKMVCDLSKIVRSVISGAPWWRFFFTDQIYQSYFLRATPIVTISAKSFSIPAIDFRGEEV